MISRADQGGVLEAVNLILNRCDKDFIDRDLRRTGTLPSLSSYSDKL